MGWIKNMFSRSYSSHDAETLRESVKLVKLKRVNDLRMQELQTSLLHLVEQHHYLRQNAIPIPQTLLETIEYLEDNLGIKMHEFVQEEEIQKHDIDSAERNLQQALEQITALREAARRRRAA